MRTALRWRSSLSRAIIAITAGAVAVGVSTDIVAVAAAHARAQATAGQFNSFSGKVESPDGKPVANATVFIYPLDSDSSTPGRIGTATTDARGDGASPSPQTSPPTRGLRPAATADGLMSSRPHSAPTLPATRQRRTEPPSLGPGRGRLRIPAP